MLNESWCEFAFLEPAPRSSKQCFSADDWQSARKAAYRLGQAVSGHAWCGMGLLQLLGWPRQSHATRSSWFLVRVQFRECQKDTDTVHALPALPEQQKSPGNMLHGCITDSMVSICYSGKDGRATQTRLIGGLMVNGSCCLQDCPAVSSKNQTRN